MKTLKEFRRSRVRMTKTQYCETYGVPGDDIMGPSLWCYADSVFISITATGYHLLIDRSDYEGPYIDTLEAVLWDDFYKEEIGLSYDQMEEDLHIRARELAKELGKSHLSLNEISLEKIVPEKRVEIMYLLNQFEHLSEKKVEPKTKKSGVKYNFDDLNKAVLSVVNSPRIRKFMVPFEVGIKDEIKQILIELGYD